MQFGVFKDFIYGHNIRYADISEGNMLRGVNRNVLVVRTDKNSRFESVYFVIKKGSAVERADIIKEANSIITRSDMTADGGRFGRRVIFGFLLGAASGGLTTMLIGLILTLFR